MKLRIKTLVAIIAIFAFITSFAYAYIKYLELKEVYEKQFSGLYLYVGESIILGTDLSRSFTDNLRYYILVRPPIYPAWQNPPPPGKRMGINNITFIPLDENTLITAITNKSVDGVLFMNPYYITLCIRENVLLSFQNESLLNEVPHFFRDPEGKWVTIAFRVYGLIINNETASEREIPRISSIRDLYEIFLNNPSLYSRKTIIISDPRINPSIWNIMLRILEVHGWSEGWKILIFLVGVSDITNSIPDAYSKVALGLYAVTFGSNDQGYSAYVLSGGSTDFLIINEALIEPLIIASTSTPSHSFVEKIAEWFLSDEGQKTLLDYSDYIPVKKVNTTNWKINLLSQVENYINTSIINYYISDNILIHSNLIKIYYESLLENTTYQYLKQIFNYLVRKNDTVLTSRIIEELVAPIEVKDPFTGDKILFTYEYIKQLNQKLNKLTPKQTSEIIEQLKIEIQKALVERYNNILNILK